MTITDSTADLYLVTYENGTATVLEGADVRGMIEDATHQDPSFLIPLDSGAFKLDFASPAGAGIQFEPVKADISVPFERLVEMRSRDGIQWQEVGGVSLADAERLLGEEVSRCDGSIWFLMSGTVVVLDGQKATLRFEPLRETRK
ncbi:hypothetical protein [Streptomyces sp. NPDC054838]